MNDQHRGRHRAADLVEPEGVNAGSEEVLEGEDAAGDAGDVTSGGHPERAGEQQRSTEQDDVTGAPADREREPGEPHGSSGQDSGSME